MSKVGRKPIEIPSGVEVTVSDTSVVVKGQKSQFEREIPAGITVEQNDGMVTIGLAKDVKKKREDRGPMWGTFRAILQNDMIGVGEGFEKILDIEGVGYTASLQGKKLVLNLGFSHPIEMEVPEDIECKVEKNSIVFSGANKETIGQFAANVRKLRPPEPYKGKGIRYRDEHVRRKEGKKAAGEGEGGGE